jgi:hypothetical protein
MLLLTGDDPNNALHHLLGVVRRDLMKENTSANICEECVYSRKTMQYRASDAGDVMTGRSRE